MDENSNETNCEINLALSQTDINECCRDCDRSSFVPYNGENKDNLEIVDAVRKEESLNPKSDDSCTVLEVGNNGDIENAVAEMKIEIVESKRNSFTVDLVRRAIKVEDKLHLELDW